MSEPHDISDFIADRIGQIPLIYGGTAEGVDLILDTYHELWALIHEREANYLDFAHAAEGCDSASLAQHYRSIHPQAPEADVARYVVDRWREIGAKLGLPS